MRTYPCILTIAGSDCSGGAGIQADIKAISALGAYAASAITAITVQNTCGVTGIHPVPPAYVKGQIEAVMEDIHPQAIKIGMINDTEIVEVIAGSLQKYRPRFVVFDPVMVSTSGCKLMEDEAIEAITTRLIPLATLITPNLSEAEILAGQKSRLWKTCNARLKRCWNWAVRAYLSREDTWTADKCAMYFKQPMKTPPICSRPRR